MFKISLHLLSYFFNYSNSRKKNDNAEQDNTPAQQQKQPVKAGASSYYNINTHPLSTEYTFWFMKKEKPVVSGEADATPQQNASYHDQVKAIGDFSTVEGMQTRTFVHLTTFL